MESDNIKEYRQAAELVRKECIKSAIEAYETASQNGVCHEGAWECAIDAMKSLELDDLLKSILVKNSKR